MNDEGRNINCAEKRYDVFISYSSKDKTTADAVCALLEQSKIRCWIAPRDVDPGSGYAGCIARAIKSSEVFVLIFSRDSNMSKHVMTELNIAINHVENIIPFKLDDTEMSDDMEYYLGSCHWLDALTPPLEQHVMKLVQTIKPLTGGRAQQDLAEDIATVQGTSFIEKNENTVIQVSGIDKSETDSPKVILDLDGTGHIVSLNDFVQTWVDSKKDMKQAYAGRFQTISAGCYYTLGLKVDGTVVATGRNDDGQCNVSNWRDIVSLSAGFSHAVGLRTDGTVVAAGSNDHYQCNVSAWRNIQAVSAGYYHTVVLKTDGTTSAVGRNSYGQCDVSSWHDIVSIDARWCYTVGLKANGMVVAVGKNDDGCCDVSEWRDIVMIAIGNYHTIGLRANGTVVSAGRNDQGQCDVARWRDIVSISAGSYHTVGLKADGTVVAIGKNDFGQCNVSSWWDIVTVITGAYHTVGIQEDGTIVAVGRNDTSQCSVSHWRDIRLPQN